MGVVLRLRLFALAAVVVNVVVWDRRAVVESRREEEAMALVVVDSRREEDAPMVSL